MSATLTNRRKNFVEDIARNEGFKQFKINYNQGSLRGDGYMGTITQVNIKETSNGKALHLILKSAQTGDDLRNKAPIRVAYERENFMYNVVFKDFVDLQKEYNVKEVFDGTAKYYGGLEEINEECLALENLREAGFKLWNRKVPMDSYHVGAVMEQYGKFHALSYAMKKLKPELFSERTKSLDDVFDMNINESEKQESTISVMDRAFKAVQDNMSAVAGLRRFMVVSQTFFKQTMKMKDKFSVILHGDCWCNNMMFKYETPKSQKPSNVHLLDWQLSTYGNPVQDLAYFFYVCSSKFCMDNYVIHLKTYHESLAKMLQQFSLDVNQIMTFQELRVQWIIYAKYGMYMSFLLTKILLADEQDAPDLTDVTKGNHNVLGLFDGKISNIGEYNKRISTVITHMVKNRFI